MGDQAQGRVSGASRDRSGFGKVSESSGSNFQTNRARARSGAFKAGGSPDDYLVEGARQGKITNKKVNVSDALTKRTPGNPNTGNDPGAKKQPNSRPIAAEKWTNKDGGHKNPQPR